MPRERHGALSRAVSRDPGRGPGRGSSRGAAALCNIGIAALFRDSDSRTLIPCNNSHKVIDYLYFRAIMAPEEGSGVRRPFCFPHRREKTPEKRTGDVRPASRARNQAHEPRRRDTRARAGTGARRKRANQGPAAEATGDGKDGTKMDRKDKPMPKTRDRRNRMEYPKPMPGQDSYQRSLTGTYGAAAFPRACALFCHPGLRAGVTVEAISHESQSDAAGISVCALSMRIMTSHDISHGVPPGPHDKT